MKWWLGMTVSGLIVWGLAESVSAQQNLQLPTFSFVTVSTTVSVPDRGSALLGGIKRSQTGRNDAGTPMLGKLPFAGRPFKNSAIGANRMGMNVHVNATIIDLSEMDEYILGSAPTPATPIGAPAGALGHVLLPRTPADAGRSWQLAATAEAEPPLSVADVQAKRSAQQASRADEAASYFERGRQAEADGKLNVAKIYYQMAARRASGDLKDRVAARLEALTLGGLNSPPQVAQSAR
jgi:hypothetical protein